MGQLCDLFATRDWPAGPITTRVFAWEGDVSGGAASVPLRIAGALHALEGNGGRLARRVAVVDFDVHHGNGTEEIARAWHERHRRSLARAGGAARDDRDVFFASIHLADDGKGSGVEFYPGTGVTSDLHQNVVNVVVPPMWRAQENVSDAVGSRKRVPKRNRDDELDGSGAALTAAKAKEKKEKEERENVAKEALLSESLVPVPPRVGDAPAGGREEWMRRLRERVLPALRAFKPDLLIISAGFDAANHDVGNVGVDRRGRRAGGANLTPEDYANFPEGTVNAREVTEDGETRMQLDDIIGQIHVDDQIIGNAIKVKFASIRI